MHVTAAFSKLNPTRVFEGLWSFFSAVVWAAMGRGNEVVLGNSSSEVELQGGESFGPGERSFGGDEVGPGNDEWTA